MNTTQAGFLAEDKAVALLLSKGHRIIARNYRQQCGEIDIISYDGKTLVFSEVKQRKSDAFGGPIAAITKRKQNKIVQTAVLYIKENAPKFDSIRFDAICLLGEQATHIPNAFTPTRSTL